MSIVLRYFYAGGTFHLRGKTESLQADISGKRQTMTKSASRRIWWQLIGYFWI
ncbi:MAG: hypothetical protein IM467_16875 [Microcystis sp. M137S2]|uniref:hypothetical protein n=1 Tax=Microcystis sp. M113S1 TaxID=2771104 RepID=UPI00258EEA20|nr:hypothetical protein [Microcystis sp. M113S1]MCA2641533.1 hypothetical protein [Microcystis sp. M087S2]MCA2756013.1 hypothetical protein [Microcystis sp. M137S2]MCA2761331.1 hypothetical protein [Microcystis sp. M151S2]NCR35068.1 hypothetical protein [Microcystis aeruginosa S11-05]